jgi:hypothetical protein
MTGLRVYQVGGKRLSGRGMGPAPNCGFKDFTKKFEVPANRNAICFPSSNVNSAGSPEAMQQSKLTIKTSHYAYKP